MMEPKAHRTACQEVQDRFPELLDGDVDGQTRQDLEAHLKGCHRCMAHWASYVATVEALGSLEELAVPPGVLEGIRNRLHRRSLAGRLAAWAAGAPWRLPVPAVAALGLFFLAAGLWQWRPWAPGGGTEPSRLTSSSTMELSSQVQPVDPLGGFPINGGFLSPVRALDPDLDWPVRGKVMIQDEMMLELTGSEEIFQRIEEILRESKGKMFLMGLRNRISGQVVRSQVLLEVPLESYGQVIRRIESLAPVQRVFLERDALPPRPDRLRITVVATDSFQMGHTAFPLQRVEAP